jgi:uncharacterized RDD family membrane protein YckC
MSLDRTRTRIIRPIIQDEPSGPVLKNARITQRLISNGFDFVLIVLLVHNTLELFDIAKIFPFISPRHELLAVIFYYYFLLTILPHHLFGQSLGQFVTGIKVVSSTYGQLPLPRIIIRDLLRPLGLFFPAAIFKKKGKTWYERWTKSTLVDLS